MSNSDGSKAVCTITIVVPPAAVSPVCAAWASGLIAAGRSVRKTHRHRLSVPAQRHSDAPVLVIADVAIPIGAGTDIAVEAGDVVLVRSGPRDEPRIIALSRASHRKMIQNLWWAAGYNVFAIPLAPVAGQAGPSALVRSPISSR